MLSNHKPTLEEIIKNSKPDFVYNHEFGEGRFFQTVHVEEDALTLQIATRTMLKVVFLKDKNDLEGLELIKLVSGAEIQKIKLSKFNLAQLKVFLDFLCRLDLREVSQRRIGFHKEDKYAVDETFIEQFKQILHEADCLGCIEKWLTEGLFTAKDIVNVGYRRQQLSIFEKMLNEDGYWRDYANQVDINSSKEEKVWQYFFENNEWLFGYGLDYKFKSILQREARISDADLDGSNSVITDFLMGDRFFTTFVEIKKPSTPIFGKSKNRSNCWCLSDDLICAVSQILEHKAAGQIMFDKPQYNGQGEVLEQKAYDSKVILLIGDWAELETAESPREKEIKKKTFELYRRDSRNIEMLTYDELYERAKFIVEGDQITKTTVANEITSCEDDLPF